MSPPLPATPLLPPAPDPLPESPPPVAAQPTPFARASATTPVQTVVFIERVQFKVAPSIYSYPRFEIDKEVSALIGANIVASAAGSWGAIVVGTYQLELDTTVDAHGAWMQS